MRQLLLMVSTVGLCYFLIYKSTAVSCTVGICGVTFEVFTVDSTTGGQCGISFTFSQCVCRQCNCLLLIVCMFRVPVLATLAYFVLSCSLCLHIFQVSSCRGKHTNQSFEPQLCILFFW